MDPIILTGSTVEKIVNEFCTTKKIEKDDLKYKVLEEGKRGLLGIFGARKASIEIEAFGAKKNVFTFVKTLLEKMKVDYVDIEVEMKNESLFIHIIGSPDAGFLIGKEARFLNNFQYLVNRIYEGKNGLRRIYLDVDGYKERQANTILKKYEPILQKVIANQKPYTLEPLDPVIRRIIHQYIDKDSQLRTLTIGEGKRKRIVVFPKDYDQTKIRKKAYVAPKQSRNYRGKDENDNNTTRSSAPRNKNYSNNNEDSENNSKPRNPRNSSRPNHRLVTDKKSSSTNTSHSNRDNDNYNSEKTYNKKPRNYNHRRKPNTNHNHHKTEQNSSDD